MKSEQRILYVVMDNPSKEFWFKENGVQATSPNVLRAEKFLFASTAKEASREIYNSKVMRLTLDIKLEDL